MFHIDLKKLASTLLGEPVAPQTLPKYDAIERQFHIDESALMERLATGKTDDEMKIAIQSALQSSCTVYVYSVDGAWTGSGFHVGAGQIITAAHVCPSDLRQRPHKIEVTFDGATLYPASIVKSDADSDAAILHCAAHLTNIPAMKLANSDTAEIGDQIAVVSSPEGWHDTATVGRVSNVHQSLGPGAPSQAWNDIIFIDAQILEGSSGGMVVNEDGQVYGIVIGVTGKLAKLGIGEHSVCPSNKIAALLSG